MISLEWLKIKAFRSFIDETTFQLPTSGLILINGKNLQTNDASGTGKSTVFLATAYALNILPSGQTAAGLQSFLTKEKMQVTVGLTDSVLGKIVVGRGASTFIEFGGNRFDGATVVNQQLEAVFGLTSEMLFTMAYRPQASGGLFLSKNDTEKKDFLTALLELDRIETAIDNADTTVKTLTKDLVSINANLASKQDLLQQIVLQDVTALVEESKKVSADILDLEADREHWEGKLKNATVTMKAEQAEVDAKYNALKIQAKTHITGLQFEDEVRKGLVEDKNKKRRDSITVEKQILAVIKVGKIELPKIDAQILALESSTCPTCSREWLLGQDKLAKLKEDRQKLKEAIDKEGEIEVLVEVLEEEMEKFIPDHRITQLQEALGTLDAKARSEYPIGTGTGEMNMLSKNHRAMQDLTAIVSRNNIQIEKQKELQSLHTSINKEVTLLNTQKTEKESKLQAETDFCKVLGKEGFLGSIFDEVLSEIVQEINTKLANVANMSAVTFDFKTEVLNTKGIVKKAIVPMVTIHGHESKLGSLSGGMLSSLEIVTDLAVKEVIERRTGKQIGFYFIDEAFNGIGKPSVEACLEILQQSASTKAFYLIDHNTETKEVFSQVIEIEMKDGISKLKP